MAVNPYQYIIDGTEAPSAKQATATSVNPYQGIVDSEPAGTLGAYGQTLKQAVKGIPAYVASAVEGSTPYDKTNGLDTIQAKANADQQAFESGPNAEAPVFGGLTTERNIRQLAPSLSGSIAGMAPTAAGAAIGSLAGPVGTVIGGLAGAGLGYLGMTRADENAFIKQNIDKTNADNQAQGLPPLTQQQSIDLQNNLNATGDPLKHGIYEAGGETLGNAAELAIGATPVGKFGTLAAKIASPLVRAAAVGGAKALGITGTEIGEELATNLGQNPIQKKYGLPEATAADTIGQTTLATLPFAAVGLGVGAHQGYTYKPTAPEVDAGPLSRAASQAPAWQQPDYKINPDANAIVNNQTVPGAPLQDSIDSRYQDGGYNPLHGAWEQPTANDIRKNNATTNATNINPDVRTGPQQAPGRPDNVDLQQGGVSEQEKAKAAAQVAGTASGVDERNPAATASGQPANGTGGTGGTGFGGVSGGVSEQDQSAAGSGNTADGGAGVQPSGPEKSQKTQVNPLPTTEQPHATPDQENPATESEIPGASTPTPGVGQADKQAEDEPVKADISLPDAYKPYQDKITKTTAKEGVDYSKLDDAKDANGNPTGWKEFRSGDHVGILNPATKEVYAYKHDSNSGSDLARANIIMGNLAADLAGRQLNNLPQGELVSTPVYGNNEQNGTDTRSPAGKGSSKRQRTTPTGDANTDLNGASRVAGSPVVNEHQDQSGGLGAVNLNGSDSIPLKPQEQIDETISSENAQKQAEAAAKLASQPVSLPTSGDATTPLAGGADKSAQVQQEQKPLDNNLTTGQSIEQEAPKTEKKNQAKTAAAQGGVKSNLKTPRNTKAKFVTAHVNVMAANGLKDGSIKALTPAVNERLKQEASDEYDNRVITALNNGETLSKAVEIPDHGVTKDEYVSGYPEHAKAEAAIEYDRTVNEAKAKGLVTRNETHQPQTPIVSEADVQDKAAVKQPWEMTKAELQDIEDRIYSQQPKAPSKRQSGNLALQSAYLNARREWNQKYKSAVKANEFHLDVIKKALSENKPVPSEVLADYPDLQKQHGQKTETSSASQNTTHLKEGGGSMLADKKDDIQNTRVSNAAKENVVAPTKAKRFEIGKSLTKEEKKKTLSTLTDVYRSKGADKETRINSNGDEYSAYPHQPELFEKSDITGKMIRHHVTLPDGRIAHPTELFPEITQAKIDAEFAKQEHEDMVAKREATRILQNQFDSISDGAKFWDDKSDEYFNKNGSRSIPNSFDRVVYEKDGKVILPYVGLLSGNQKVVDELNKQGWRKKEYGKSKQTTETSPVSLVERADQSGDVTKTRASSDGSAVPSAAGEEKVNAITGNKINREWTKFADESGSLGIPRAEMPQVKAEHRGALVNFLNARGIPHEQVDIPAKDLKPTQAEFSPGKVEKAKKYEGGDRSILISSDNHVVDGHHQWLAKLDNGENIKAIRLNAPIKTILDDVREFPSSETSNGATKVTPTTPLKESAAEAVDKQDQATDSDKSTTPNDNTEAVHIEGEGIERVTPAVIDGSLEEAADNTPLKTKTEMREWLVKKIDAAILRADSYVERGYSQRKANGKKGETEISSLGIDEMGKRTFDVPGDGKFKVTDSKEHLAAFKEKVLKSSGFNKTRDTTGNRKHSVAQADALSLVTRYLKEAQVKGAEKDSRFDVRNEPEQDQLLRLAAEIAVNEDITQDQLNGLLKEGESKVKDKVMAFYQQAKADSADKTPSVGKTPEIEHDKTDVSKKGESVVTSNVIGKGNTGDVVRIGDEAIKNSTNDEAKVYAALNGVEGVTQGYEKDGKIHTPFYKHIISTDVIAPDARKGMSAILKKNVERINNAVSALINSGYNYNEPYFQFGMNDDQTLDLMDFSNADNKKPDEALSDNLSTLARTYKVFGLERVGNAVSQVNEVLRNQYHHVKYGTNAILGDEFDGANYKELTDRLDGKKAENAYYTTNERYVNLKDAAQTDNIDGVKTVLSVRPLTDKEISDWELTPVVTTKPTAEPKGAVADKGETLLESHKSLNDRLDSGEITADELKASFEKLVANKDAAYAELNKLTKDVLAKKYIRGYVRNDATKADFVRDAYRGMLADYKIADGMISYGMGKDGYLNAIREFVNNTTDADIKDYAESLEKAKEERAAHKAEVLAGMDNPETADDFARIMRTRFDEKRATGLEHNDAFNQARMEFTPEQREKFDSLNAEKSRGDRQAKADQQKTVVRVAAQTTEGQVVETKHTKTGEPLFVVKAADRVDRDIYNHWNATAKRLGGYYSSFRGAGAVPGFQFKTRENADAFLKFLGGDVADAKEMVQARRDSFADDRNQTAIERLNEMADKLEEKADESLGRERKANTHKRAGEAARAESYAQADKAMAATMRNIAAAIQNGTAKLLDRVRQKVQVEMLQGFVHTAQYDKLVKDYPNYGDQQKHQGEKPTKETADYATFPQYTAYRSDLANLGRSLIEMDGTKKLGQRLMKVADDVNATYLKFAKEHINEVSVFRNKNGDRAAFSSKPIAEEAIRRSGYKGTAIVLPFKRGENLIILSPSEAIKRGVWKGDNDKRITLSGDFGAELVEKMGKAARRGNKVSVPWQFESAYEKRKRLAAMGIETPAELRAALREFIGLREAPKEADKIKQMERAMIGRANDGLDFFPTSASAADEAIAAADIKEGMSIYEPQAGMGHIADKIREAGVEPDVGELSNNRRELLEAKGYNLVSRDFLDMRMEDTPNGAGYDRIIMNPPFSDRRDAIHIQHAYSLLKPGGRLVSIAGEGVFFGNDKKAVAFRDWLEQVGGTEEKLPEGSFLDPSLPVNTGVNARMVVIDKPEGDINSSGDNKFSKSTPTTGSTVANPHTEQTMLQAIRKTMDSKFYPGWTNALLATGKFKVISLADAKAIIGGQTKFSQSEDGGIEAKYSKNGDIVAFYDPKTDTSYLVHDNISQDASAKEVSGLLSHEIAVHQLRLLRSDAEFQALLKKVAAMSKVQNSKMAQAAIRVPTDTKAAHVNEEILAYFSEQNPDHSITQKLIQLIRKALRAIGRTLPMLERTKWMRWANTLSENDIISMANEALRSAPTSLLFDNVGREHGSIRLSYEQGVDDVLDGKGKGSLNLGNTPNALIHSGLPNVPLMIAEKVIDKAHFDHALTKKQLKSLPDLLANPLMVFKSDTQPGSFVVITHEFQRNDPVMVAIKPNGEIERIKPVNIITSTYGKPAGVIGSWIKKGLLISSDKKAALAFATTNGLQLPAVVQLIRKSLSITVDDAKLSVKSNDGKTNTPDSTERLAPNGKPSNLNAVQYAQVRTPEFKKWFGDWENDPENASKVVDENGEPRIVWHGTRHKFTEFEASNPRGAIGNKKGIYFTADKRTAQEYAEDVDGETDDKSNVIGAFINISTDKDGQIKDSAYSGREYIVFDSSKIKSATANNGQFSAENNDIRYSHAGDAVESNNPLTPSETKLQATQRLVQDKMIRFEVIQQKAELEAAKAGGYKGDNIFDARDFMNERGIHNPISDETNVHQAESLRAGIASALAEDFRETKMNPLIQEAHKAGVTMEDISDFLKMQHVEEANKRIREVRSNEPDATAFGITDAEAKAALDEYKARPDYAKLKAIADKWRSLTSDILQMKVDEGLIPQEQADAYNQTFALYVPVKGEEDAGTPQGTGKGLSVYAKDKRRLGHGARDEKIIENIIKDYENTINLIEKNKVGKIAGNFIREINDPAIGTLGQPVKRQVFMPGGKHYMVTYHGSDVQSFDNLNDARAFVDEESQKVDRKKSDFYIDKNADASRVILQAKPILDDNEFQYYVDGKAIRGQWNDELLAQAYKNLGVDHVNKLLEGAREFNAFLSKAYTGYSPTFLIKNPIRDAIQGMITNTSKLGIGTAAKIFKAYPHAMKELSAHFKAHGSSAEVNLYRKSGGNTGASYVSDTERIGKDIMDAYNEYAGAIDTYHRTYADLIAKGRNEKAAQAMALVKAGKAGFLKTPIVGHFLRYMEHANAVTENALRLATFNTLIKEVDANGKRTFTAAQAALHAKDLMNFNRKGELTIQAGALYLFFNPNVQGTHVLVSALADSKYKNQARALAGTMVLSAFLLAEAMRGGDDDDERKWKMINHSVKDRNMIFGSGDTKLMLPVPYGYGIFHTLGNAISDFAHGESAWKLGVRMTAGIFDNFSPVGNPVDSTHDAFQLLPTIPKMVMAPSVNENSFGSPITPDKFNQNKPDSQTLYRNTKGTAYADLASGLNSITGGNKYKPGLIDVSPETLKFWMSTLTGGAGQFAMDAINTGMVGAQGVAPELKEIPVLKAFTHEIGVGDARRSFWEAANEAKAAADEFSMAKKAGDRQSASQIMADKRPLIALSKIATRQEVMLKKLRDAEDIIRVNDNLSLSQRRAQAKQLEAKEVQVYKTFLSAFDRAK